jgi:hypothetical protein
MVKILGWEQKSKEKISMERISQKKTVQRNFECGRLVRGYTTRGRLLKDIALGTFKNGIKKMHIP